MPTRVAVVGAGAPGLSSALRILQQFPALDVTVIADKFNMDTTSAVAAGFVSAFVTGLGNPESEVRQWSHEGLKWYTQLADGPDSKESGVIFTSGYDLSVDQNERQDFSPCLRNFRRLTSEELEKFSPNYKSGFFYTTVMVEGKYYLPWLLKRIKSLGGHVIKKKIHNFCELADEYDIVINCAGLTNMQLSNDASLVGLRGQVMRMKAPWVKHFYFDRSNGIYLFCGRDHIIVGGVKQSDNYSLEVDKKDSKRILEGATNLIPLLKGATVDIECVGIRPYRQTVRIERELIKSEGKQIQIIHNYGHGSEGVNLSWGTAGKVASLLGEILPRSKL